MLNIISDSRTNDNIVTLHEKNIKKAVDSAIEAIKNELPEEVHSVEVMEYVVSEISQSIKEKTIML